MICFPHKPFVKRDPPREVLASSALPLSFGTGGIVGFPSALPSSPTRPRGGSPTPRPRGPAGCCTARPPPSEAVSWESHLDIPQPEKARGQKLNVRPCQLTKKKRPIEQFCRHSSGACSLASVLPCPGPSYLTHDTIYK